LKPCVSADVICAPSFYSSSARCFFVDSAVVERLQEPLQGKIEEWKRVAMQLDKDHSRGLFNCPLILIYDNFFMNACCSLCLYAEWAKLNEATHFS